MDKFNSDGVKIVSNLGGGGGGITNIRLSAGTTSNLLSAFTLSNSNNVSFGLNASTVTAIVSAIGALGVSTDGNTAGNTRVVTGINFIIAGSNNITVHQSTAVGGPDTIWITGAAGGGGLTNINVSAGTTSNNLSNLVFSNSNNVSFGLNGSTITATATFAGGGLTNINVSAGTTSNNLSNLVFSNSNNVSFGLDGSTITATVTVATSLSNIRVSAGTTSNLLSAVTFSNSNGISFGINASTITASHNGITSQTNQQMTLFATGNTTLSSSGTSNASSLIFRGSGVASVGITNGSILIDVPAGGGGITNINISAGTTSQNLSNFVLSNSNGVSFGLNGSTVTASVAAAGGAQTLSYWQNIAGFNNLASVQYSNALLHVMPLEPHGIFPGVMTVSTMFFNLSGTVSTAATFTRNVSIGFYTLVNSTQLSLAFSASTSWGTGAANMNINDSFGGYRWLTFHSSQWNNAPGFSQTKYWMAIWNQTSGNASATFSFVGVPAFSILTTQRSGILGAVSENNASLKWHPFLGAYSASFTTAMPNSLAASDLVKTQVNLTQLPHVQFNNMGSNIV